MILTKVEFDYELVYLAPVRRNANGGQRNILPKYTNQPDEASLPKAVCLDYKTEYFCLPRRRIAGDPSDISNFVCSRTLEETIERNNK